MKNSKPTAHATLFLPLRLPTLRLSKQWESPIVLSGIAFLSLIALGVVTFLGFSIQNEYGLLYKFSFGNMAILSVSALFVITVSQFFLVRDKVFLYYSWYLVLNIAYFHYTTLGIENKLLLPTFTHYFVGLMLIGGYYVYMKFAIYFLNLEKNHPDFARRLHFYAFLYFVLLVMDTGWSIYMHDDKYRWVAGRMILIFCCIPIGLIGISECFLKLKGRLAYIFLGGSICYFVGSVLGFIFSSRLIINPFDNPILKNWTFFTEAGQEIEQELLRQRVKELETEQALLLQRERISHDLHDDVGTTLNSISVFSVVALQQDTQISPLTVHFLNRIGEASRHVIDTINDIIWVVNPKNDQFENIILRMRLFAADLLMPKNVEVDFEADAQLNHINLSIEQRKHFYLVFKEAINNVFKYASCSSLKIHITFDGKVICMVVCDNGKGFDVANPKNGNGLRSMQKRAELLRGALAIFSNAESGTTVQLCFPVEETDEDVSKLPERVGKQPKKVVRFVAEVI
jgi:signal transduction histidine kinase